MSKVSTGLAVVSQRIALRGGRVGEFVKVFPMIGKVTVVYSEKHSCDVEMLSGVDLKNVPVKTDAGLNEAGEIYGTANLPAKGTYVVIAFLNGSPDRPYIDGELIPYLYSKFKTDQVAANSASKAFSLKLLETAQPLTERHICKSGTTIEVGEDGTTVIETPSGAFIQIDEAGGIAKVSLPGGTFLELGDDYFNLTDGGGNTVVSSGSAVTINGNLEVTQ